MLLRLSKSLVILLACTAAFTFLWVNPGGAATSEIDLRMTTSASSTTALGYVDLYVSVRSTSTKPLRNIDVMLSPCPEGQQTPFELRRRTRHLVPGVEKLESWSDGAWLLWKIAQVPPISAKAKQLHMQLKLPQRKGGPTFCVQGQAFHAYPKNEAASPAVMKVWELE